MVARKMLCVGQLDIGINKKTLLSYLPPSHKVENPTFSTFYPFKAEDFNLIHTDNNENSSFCDTKQRSKRKWL